jgi:hypothetical protein
VNFVRYLEAGAEESFPLNVVLPLAMTSLLTLALFSVQWVVQLIGDRGQSSQKHKSFSKGARP